MAPRKNNRTDGVDPSKDGELRHKYAELARKYAGVVSSLERRSTERVVSRFGWLGLQGTGTAFALVRGASGGLSKRPWKQLAVSDGSWRRRSDADQPKNYPDLDALAVAEAKVAVAAETGTVIEV